MGKVNILIFSEDPFFQQQVQQREISCQFFSDENEFLSVISESNCDSDAEVLFILDLMVQRSDPSELISQFIQRCPNGQIVAFVHPAAMEKKMIAKMQGVRYVFPRQMFLSLLDWVQNHFVQTE